MINVSRSEWNARPPTSTSPLDKSKVKNFIVHYSGASREQSVRSIQDFCMDVKGHSDIDYNDIVRGDHRYVGRGWNLGGHTKDNNSTSYGVCVIGVDGDATDADKLTVRKVYDEVCSHLGRNLVMTDHRNVLGASYTDCPGNELDAWVDSGMPYTSGDGGEDMPDWFKQEDWDNHRWRQYDVDVVGNSVASGGPAAGQHLWLPKFLKDVAANVATLNTKVDQLLAQPPGSVDREAIRQVVREELDKTRYTPEVEVD